MTGGPTAWSTCWLTRLPMRRGRRRPWLPEGLDGVTPWLPCSVASRPCKAVSWPPVRSGAYAGGASGPGSASRAPSVRRVPRTDAGLARVPRRDPPRVATTSAGRLARSRRGMALPPPSLNWNVVVVAPLLWARGHGANWCSARVLVPRNTGSLWPPASTMHSAGLVKDGAVSGATENGRASARPSLRAAAAPCHGTRSTASLARP